MSWKYQESLTTLGIQSFCPPKEVNPVDLEGFRWVINPIENELNFLPNFHFDSARNNADAYYDGTYDDTRKCLRCAQSFFISQDAAVFAFNKMSGKLKAKMGYTHVASGRIAEQDGAATEVNRSGHFSFYESVGCDLKVSFTICVQLDLE